ncbi:21491_t:CDS:2, partial [Dentiscutata erythropus]
EQLKQGGMNTIQEIKIPFVPSLTFAKVVRDGVVRNFPTPLLVEGDIVEMLYGDKAPCKIKLLSEFRDSTSPSSISSSSKILEMSQ